jgi:hypothetical protein
MHNTQMIGRRAMLAAVLATLTAAVAVAVLLPTTPALAFETCDEPVPPPSCQEPPPPPPGSPPCQLFVEQPTDTYFPGQLEPNIITGGGGRLEGACGSQTSTVTVRLRQDKPWQLDRTLAQETSSDGFVNLTVTYVCDDHDAMKIFTETLTSSGQKLRSPTLYTYCG